MTDVTRQSETAGTQRSSASEAPEAPDGALALSSDRRGDLSFGRLAAVAALFFTTGATESLHQLQLTTTYLLVRASR